MDGPALPQVTHESLANPPLKVMLGQIHYPALLRLYEGPLAVAGFQAAVGEYFPNLEVQQVAVFGVGPIGQVPGQEPPTQQAPTYAYRFESVDKAWTLQLTPDAMTLEAGPGGDYSSFDSFSELFPLAIEALNTEFSPTQIVRQGLRYVDHIEGERVVADWASTINPTLLGPLNDEVLSTGLRTSMTELRYPDEGHELIFRHGISEAGPNSRLGYLLDFDSIHLSPFKPTDVDGVMSRFDESHALVYRFFRWCITDEAMEEFRGQ